MDGRAILDDFANYPLTDIGSSKLYADMFKDELRFVRERGAYFHFNGKVWIEDTGSIFAKRLAKKFAILTVKQANDIEDDGVRKMFLEHYAKFNGFNAREKLVKDAQTVHIMDYAEFDDKPELYNCQSGTFNLKTGALQKHDPGDLLTQISNVTYDAGARCGRWERYIDEITEGDEQSKNLLQMIAGYCLSGSTKFECFFVLYGKSSRNGKGTFNSTMMKMHGGYAQALNKDCLSAKSFYGNGEAPNEAIASLAGARYVCVSEPGENFILDSDLIKTLTGGDPIRARFLKQHFFTYVPCFKIVINTNHLPKILDDTVFESDRLMLLNFNVHYDADSRDNTLKKQFVKPEALSGIFNWCYDGYKMLERSGTLKMPDKSKMLFDQYREESNIEKQFISEVLIPVEGARLKFKSVYDEYKDWAKENGYCQCSRRTLRGRLERYLKIATIHKQDVILNYDLQRETQIPFS